MKIKQLLRYRGCFARQYDQLYRWEETKEVDGIIIPGHPVYDAVLLRFINEIYDSGLLLGNYMEILSQSGLQDFDLLIGTGDMRAIRALLTYYVRREHTENGLWGRAVRKKCFLRILDRLAEIA